MRSPRRSSPPARNGRREADGVNGADASRGGHAARKSGAGAGAGVDREKTCPMLLRVFCSTSRHNPMADYNRGKVPANELQIYTWKDASLKELTSLIREVNADARRRGTYFDFALVYPSPRVNSANHYTSRDIGTTVSGQKGPDDSKTLAQTSYTVGDYLDVAITPPIGRADRFGGGPGGGGGGGGGPRRRPRDDRGGPGGGRFRPY